MNIIWQIFNIISLPKTEIMIAYYKNLMGIWQVDEPVEEIKSFLLCSTVSEVATMYDNISSWQIRQLLMLVVGIGDLKYC